MGSQDMDSQDMDLQHQDIYFTNLLDENFTMSLDDSPPLLPDNPTSVKKSIRGANFNDEEDKLLVSAWLNCTLDAVQGTDQKLTQFWEKIFEYFEQHKVTTIVRTIKSLSHRWSFIQRATNNFCSYLAQVERLNQSGATEHDKFEKAKIMYKSLQKSKFQFEHCWHILKNEPKWISRNTKEVPKQRSRRVSSSTTTDTPSSTQNVIENEVIELDRPMGRKAEKAKRKAGILSEETIKLSKKKYTLLEESHNQEKEFYRLKARKMEYDKDKEEKRLHHEDERLRLKAEKLRLDGEKVELAKKESDQKIMMMDVNVLPEMQRLYFQELQREVMMRCNHD